MSRGLELTHFSGQTRSTLSTPVLVKLGHINISLKSTISEQALLDACAFCTVALRLARLHWRENVASVQVSFPVSSWLLGKKLCNLHRDKKTLQCIINMYFVALFCCITYSVVSWRNVPYRIILLGTWGLRSLIDYLEGALYKTATIVTLTNHGIVMKQSQIEITFKICDAFCCAAFTIHRSSIFCRLKPIDTRMPHDITM